MPPRPDVRAVLLDLDGTLYDEKSAMRRALAVTLAEAAKLVPGLDTTGAAESYTRIGRPIWQRADTGWRTGGTAPPSSLEVRREVWRSLLESLGASADPEVGERLATIYQEARRGDHTVFPETREVLEALKARIPLALVSNGASDLQREKLEACGLTGYFDAVLISAEIGRAKPDPELFRLALDRVGGGDPGEALFVGDSPAHDVAGGRRAGMKVAWINRDGGPYPPELPPPDHALPDLRGLPRLLGPRLAPALLALAVAAAGCGEGPPAVEPARAGDAPADYVEQVGRHRARKDDLFRTGPDSPLPDRLRMSFTGLEYYPTDPSWRYEGKLAVYPRPERMTIVGTTGERRAAERWAAFIFLREDRRLTLQVYRLFDTDGTAGGHLFLPFTDETTGRETYPAGRYVEPEVSEDGSAVVDFNLAYYPFCAYGKPYDCPITPAENRLDIAVRAGERGGMHGVPQPPPGG